VRTKTFDCVAMKHEIQQMHRQLYGRLSWEERNRIIRQSLGDDPHLGRLREIETDSTLSPRTGPSEVTS